MTDNEFMREVLQRIATGPTLSKDLSREDARRAMRLVLTGQADEVQAGIFLIALRMKRETDEELAGILDAINEGVEAIPVDVDHLLYLADPYDGYLRGTPAAPFLPAVLAACGVPVLSHGVQSMGPKFGATHHSVLQAAGYKQVSDTDSAARRIESAGWVYVDQACIAPELASLASLRTRIVKRPCLTTIEVAVNPFRPKQATHLVTGFVHKPYPPVYARLALQSGFASSIMVRGVEGGVVPSLTQAARYFIGEAGKALSQIDIAPTEVGIQQLERAVPLPPALQVDGVRSVKAPGNTFAVGLSAHAAELGLQALVGEKGYVRDSLVYAGAVILQARGPISSLSDAADKVREALDNGRAMKSFRTY